MSVMRCNDDYIPKWGGHAGENYCFRKREVMSITTPVSAVRRPLVQYTLHPHTKRYNGCFVAMLRPDGKIHIGWSQCRVNEHFNKKLGREIAIGRAVAGTNEKPCPYRFYNPDGSFKWRNTFQEELTLFKARALAYFTPRLYDEEDQRLVLIIEPPAWVGQLSEGQ
jgi:hypothetical protein